MLAPVCELGLESIVFKKTESVLSFGAVEKLGKGQKPKSTGCHADS
jgi:hypothetical protein